MNYSLGLRSRGWRQWSAAGLLLWTGSQAHAQVLGFRKQACPPAAPVLQEQCPAPQYPAPWVTPTLPARPPETTAPGAAQPGAAAPGATPPAAPDAGQTQAPSSDLASLDPGASQRTGGDSAISAPNMQGNLLYGSRSVLFSYNRVQGSQNVSANGSTGIVNSKVADNNSPVPQDRFSFRFNYFNNSTSVAGIGEASGPPSLIGSTTLPIRVKEYDTELYTFSLEKTFLCGVASVELRVPFQTGLASKLNLVAGDVTSVGPGTDEFGNPILGVSPTLDKTLGHEATEWGNLTVITKGILFDNRKLLVSAGMGIGIPTGPDNRVTVIDYTGRTIGGTLLEASIQRERDFLIRNETVSLTPFVSFLATPTSRFFTQGFIEFDVPLNSSQVVYDNLTNANGFVVPGVNGLPQLPPPPGIKYPPFREQGLIDEQTLMQVDIGTGYWLVRNPGSNWLTGLAATLELHYTTTLNDADIIRFSSDPVVVQAPGQPAAVETRPTVGNLRNRVDILDMTVGATFELNNRLTIAHGFAFPLKTGDNRTFDWEYLFQLNYYFGGPRGANMLR